MSSYELPQLENYYFQRGYSRLLSLPLPGFAIVAPLGILGLLLSFRLRRPRLLSLFLIAHVASIVAFFVVARYRLPVVPVLILGASFIAVDAYDRLRAGTLRRVWWAVPTLVLLLFLVNANLYGVDRLRAFGQAHYRLGLIYGDRGELDRAAAEYGMAIELDPDYTKSYLNLGAILAESGRTGEAADVFRRAVEIDPAYAAARVNLAIVLRQQGRPEEAISELRGVLEAEPRNAMAMTQLGVSLYKQGRTEEAKRTFEEAALCDEDGRERAEIQFYLAQIERPRPAALSPETVRTMARADSLVRGGRAFEARRLLGEAAAASPGAGEPLMKLAFVERDMGLLDEAIGHMEEALRTEPSLPHGNYTLGVFLNESGRHDAAIQAYEAELRIDPGFGPAQLNLAATYLFHLANKNLATDKSVTVSDGWQGAWVPANAVDGVTDNSSGWHADPYPQWLQVDLGKTYSVGRVKLYAYSDGARSYQYTIEASTDGKEWKQIVDMTKNVAPSTKEGDEHHFDPIEVRYVRVNMLRNSANPGVHINELMVFEAK